MTESKRSRQSRPDLFSAPETPDDAVFQRNDTPSNETGRLRSERRRSAGSCSRCSATWWDARAAHCAGCCRSFSSVTLFDRHRDQRGDRGRCLDPEEIRTESGERVMFFRDGMWRGPELSDEQKARLYGSAS